MMEQNIYFYLLAAALTVYGIRALPLTLIQKEISNTFIRSFLYYVPYVTLSVMAVPAIIMATASPVSGAAALVTAAAVAYFDGNLFKVAISSCAVVYLTEWILG